MTKCRICGEQIPLAGDRHLCKPANQTKVYNPISHEALLLNRIQMLEHQVDRLERWKDRCDMASGKLIGED